MYTFSLQPSWQHECICGLMLIKYVVSIMLACSGYMAPKYAMHGLFSVKSDVYSCGVLILKIISGKKVSSFYQLDGEEDLLSYVSSMNQMFVTLFSLANANIITSL
jgi:serine/threonine protein kinase